MKKILIAAMFMMTCGMLNAQLATREEQDLRFMREEEKLANDVYETFFEKWNTLPFKNIKKAERVHMKLIKDLLVQYKVTDPLEGIENTRGKFHSAPFDTMYARLVATGAFSVQEAYKSGALIEEMDIRDLKIRYEATQEAPIRNTYTLLRQASENHLRAFVRNLKRLGVDYTPQVLSREDFDNITGKSNTGRGQGRRRS